MPSSKGPSVTIRSLERCPGAPQLCCGMASISEQSNQTNTRESFKKHPTDLGANRSWPTPFTNQICGAPGAGLTL